MWFPSPIECFLLSMGLLVTPCDPLTPYDALHGCSSDYEWRMELRCFKASLPYPFYKFVGDFCLKIWNYMRICVKRPSEAYGQGICIPAHLTDACLSKCCCRYYLPLALRDSKSKGRSAPCSSKSHSVYQVSNSILISKYFDDIGVVPVLVVFNTCRH